MNILFLCTANRNRSKTAEVYLFKIYPSHDIRSAGLSIKLCAKENTTLATIEMLEWADKIFVMEDMHIERIHKHSTINFDEKLVNIDIPDIYLYMQKELVELLLDRVSIELI
jgi:predicted protein tyrosine phosphatase